MKKYIFAVISSVLTLTLFIASAVIMKKTKEDNIPKSVVYRELPIFDEKVSLIFWYLHCICLIIIPWLFIFLFEEVNIIFFIFPPLMMTLNFSSIFAPPAVYSVLLLVETILDSVLLFILPLKPIYVLSHLISYLGELTYLCLGIIYVSSSVGASSLSYTTFGILQDSCVLIPRPKEPRDAYIFLYFATNETTYDREKDSIVDYVTFYLPIHSFIISLGCAMSFKNSFGLFISYFCFIILSQQIQCDTIRTTFLIQIPIFILNIFIVYIGGKGRQQKDEQNNEQNNEQKDEQNIEQKDEQNNEQNIEQKDDQKEKKFDFGKNIVFKKLNGCFVCLTVIIFPTFINVYDNPVYYYGFDNIILNVLILIVGVAGVIFFGFFAAYKEKKNYCSVFFVIIAAFLLDYSSFWIYAKWKVMLDVLIFNTLNTIWAMFLNFWTLSNGFSKIVYVYHQLFIPLFVYFIFTEYNIKCGWEITFNIVFTIFFDFGLNFFEKMEVTTGPFLLILYPIVVLMGFILAIIVFIAYACYTFISIVKACDEDPCEAVIMIFKKIVDIPGIIFEFLFDIFSC